MTDTAKVAELLREIACMAASPVDATLGDIKTIHTRAEAALRALGAAGEEADVWRACLMGDGSGGWFVEARNPYRVIASGLDECKARRIASDHNRLARLERAAREVLRQWAAGIRYVDFKPLRAALDHKET